MDRCEVNQLDYAEIAVGAGKFAQVDIDDLPLLCRYKWSTCGGYAKCSTEVILMHRLIMGLTSFENKLEVDHINGDKLDNRKSNLRICTRQKNQMNKKGHSRSGFKGVMRNRSSKTVSYQARLTYNGVEFYLGCFPTAEMAAKAYDSKAREVFREYAKLNFPDESR